MSWNLSTLSDLWICLQKWLIRVLELGRWSCKRIFPFSHCHVFSLTLPVRKQRYTKPGLGVFETVALNICYGADSKNSIWCRHLYNIDHSRWLECFGGVAALWCCLYKAFSPLCCSWLNPDNNRSKKWKKQPPLQKPLLDLQSLLHFQELSLWIGRRQPGWRFPTDWRGVVGQAFLVTGS